MRKYLLHFLGTNYVQPNSACPIPPWSHKNPTILSGKATILGKAMPDATPAAKALKQRRKFKATHQPLTI